MTLAPSKPHRCSVCDKIIRDYNETNLCNYHNKVEKARAVRLMEKKGKAVLVKVNDA